MRNTYHILLPLSNEISNKEGLESSVEAHVAMKRSHREDDEEQFARRRMSFNEVAALYDRARPQYPEQLYDDLLKLGEFGDELSALEIGSGTGKASIALAKRVSHLICIEPGAELARIARKNLKEHSCAKVVNSTFEAWSPTESFDLVFAAVSWHWLDREARFKKAAAILKPGGHLAVVTNAHVFPEDFDRGFSGIRDCYNAIREATDWSESPQPKPDDTPDEHEQIEESGLFENVQVKRYLWALDYSAEAYIDLLETYSDHRTMSLEGRKALYICVKKVIDGQSAKRIRKHYLTILNLAQVRA